MYAWKTVGDLKILECDYGNHKKKLKDVVPEEGGVKGVREKGFKPALASSSLRRSTKPALESTDKAS